MADPNLRCQIANVSTLPPIPDGNRIISNIATDMADIMLSTETELTHYQVANVAILPLIPDGNRISNIATDMADVMLSTEPELARSKRPRGARGRCAGPVVETEMNAAWQQGEETKRRLRAEPHNSYF